MDRERDTRRHRERDTPRHRERDTPRHRETDPPHDILAAEAFALGERDPGLHREPAHDILAAEAFAVPAADRGTRHIPPDEHTADPAPQDVLAAEEYAMPAGAAHSLPPGSIAAAGRRRSVSRIVGFVLGLLVVRAIMRGRRRR